MKHTWREADAGDRSALKKFICTDPEHRPWDPHRRRKHHPAEWEYEVQAAFRKAKPPIKDHSLSLLLNADGAICAAILLHLDRNHPEGPIFVLDLIGVAQEHKGRGYGTLALSMLLADLAFERHQGDDYGVLARIDPRNKASQALFERSGFVNLGNVPDKHYETWVHIGS